MHIQKINSLAVTFADRFYRVCVLFFSVTFVPKMNVMKERFVSLSLCLGVCVSFNATKPESTRQSMYVCDMSTQIFHFYAPKW